MYAKVRCLIAIKSLIKFATCHKPAVSNINCSFIFSTMSNSYFPEKTSAATRSPMGQTTIGQMFDKTVDNLILMMMMMMMMIMIMMMTMMMMRSPSTSSTTAG